MSISDSQTVTMHKCEQCGASFAEELEQCPECESENVHQYEMANPFSRLPMEDILRVTAHAVWIFGVVACLMLFWNTDYPEDKMNYIMLFSGIGALAASLIFSIALFGLSESLRRMIRVQRRLRAFSEEYDQRQRRKKMEKRLAEQAAAQAGGDLL